ncbi:MAG: RES family NAD+ phosphorylase [Opitutales bacterium]
MELKKYQAQVGTVEDLQKRKELCSILTNLECMNPHPAFPAIFRRLSERLDSLAQPFSGEVFRFIDPRFSTVDDQFSGKGSLFADGRWSLHRNGHCVAYTSLQAETAFAEALAAVRYYGFPDSKAAPLVFVTAGIDLKRVVDLREGKVRQQLRISKAVICETDWRTENYHLHESLTQAWGRALVETGPEAVVVPSAAWGKGSNLVAFPANFRKKSCFSVIQEIDWPHP